MHVAAINDGGASSRSVKVLLEFAPPRAIILGGWWRGSEVVDSTAVAPAEQGWVVDVWDGLVGSRRSDRSLHGHSGWLSGWLALSVDRESSFGRAVGVDPGRIYVRVNVLASRCGWW